MHIYERQKVFTMGYLREPDPKSSIPSPFKINRWPSTEKTPAELESAPPVEEVNQQVEEVEQPEERHWWGNIIRTFGKDK